MKREIITTVIVLGLAFVAGRAISPAGETNSGKDAAPASAKSSGRVAGIRGQHAGKASESWAKLRRRAGLSEQALLDEWVTLGIGNNENDWLTEHLLRTNPAAAFREAEASGLKSEHLATLWCNFDPQRAVPLLLEGKRPFDLPINPDLWSSPVHFKGMGREDPEAGLKLLLGLKAADRKPTYFQELLEGLGSADPSKVADCFKTIVDSGAVKPAYLSSLLPELARNAPQEAQAWVQDHYPSVPPRITAALAKGLADSDLPAAMKVFAELTDKSVGESAASKISLNLARDSSDLDACLAWLDANLPGKEVSFHQSNLVSFWTWRHQEEAAELFLRKPEWLTGRHSGEAIELLKSLKREDDLRGLLGRLPPEQADKLRPQLVMNDAIQEPGKTLQPDELLARLNSAPEEAEAIWEAMPEENRDSVLRKLANSRDSSQDPEQVLQFLARFPEKLAASLSGTVWKRLTQRDPLAAARLVESLPQDVRTSEMVVAVAGTWGMDDSTAAEAWRKKMTASPE